MRRTHGTRRRVERNVPHEPAATQGVLRVTSAAVVFEPEAMSAPMLRIPIDALSKSDSAVDVDGVCIVLQPDVVVEGFANGLPHPLTTRRGAEVGGPYRFAPSFGSPAEMLSTIREIVEVRKAASSAKLERLRNKLASGAPRGTKRARFCALRFTLATSTLTGVRTNARCAGTHAG